MIFELKQNDTFPPLRLRLTSGAAAVNLTGATVTLRIAGIGNRAMVVEDALQGIVRYDWQTADTAVAGTFAAETKVAYPGTARQTVPTLDQLTIRIHREVTA